MRGAERSRSDWRETPLWERNDAFLLCWFSFVIYLYLELRRVPCLCILSSRRRALRTKHGCVVLCVKTRQRHDVHVTNTSGWASRGRWCELRCCGYLRLPHDERVAMSWPDTHTFLKWFKPLIIHSAWTSQSNNNYIYCAMWELFLLFVFFSYSEIPSSIECANYNLYKVMRNNGKGMYGKYDTINKGPSTLYQRLNSRNKQLATIQTETEASDLSLYQLQRHAKHLLCVCRSRVQRAL